MQPEVYYGEYYSVETTVGTEIIPDNAAGNIKEIADLQQYCEGRILPSECVVFSYKGWLARLSMPGYLDCTDWTAHDSEEEARDYLADLYNEDVDYHEVDHCGTCGGELSLGYCVNCQR